MLEQITLHMKELGERSPFLDTKDSNVYVVLVSRGGEGEVIDGEAAEERMDEVTLADGAKQLADELQHMWDEVGVGGDFQIAGRFPPGCETFEHIDVRGAGS